MMPSVLFGKDIQEIKSDMPLLIMVDTNFEGQPICFMHAPIVSFSWMV
jgi:hypothetical protein